MLIELVCRMLDAKLCALSRAIYHLGIVVIPLCIYLLAIKPFGEDILYLLVVLNGCYYLLLSI